MSDWRSPTDVVLSFPAGAGSTEAGAENELRTDRGGRQAGGSAFVVLPVKNTPKWRRGDFRAFR